MFGTVGRKPLVVHQGMKVERMLLVVSTLAAQLSVSMHRVKVVAAQDFYGLLLLLVVLLI